MKYFLIAAACLLFNQELKSQFYFNYSEKEIRTTFASQADRIDVIPVAGQTTVMIQLYSSVYAFKLNKETALCDFYSVRVDDPNLILKWINDFNKNYVVLVENQKWQTKYKGKTVTIAMRYTASTNATSFLFTTDN